ncbi:MAG: type II toxin-antitoxin system RatA family toxin [Gammaproteobacteria bacterium]|nr:type II toxin-antitoxin system RatA family toxin [Gammaproteobacteria bacterium]
MRQIKRTALVPYACEVVFEVVDQIDAYSEFLPWCAESQVLHRTEMEVIATLVLAKSGIRQSFTTKNQLIRPNAIGLSLVDGPFKQLEGVWAFDALGDAGCKISLDMRFEFSSKLMDQTFGRVFGVAADRLVDAFTARLDDLYG